jgi:hypothetical protein
MQFVSTESGQVGLQTKALAVSPPHWGILSEMVILHQLWQLGDRNHRD